MSDAPLRILVTGAAGFVGYHLLDALSARFGGRAVLTPTSRRGEGEGRAFAALDITDADAVRAMVAAIRPTHVVNLAAIAASADARRDPSGAWALHVHGAVTLARAILAEAPACWLLNVGSGLVYGDSAASGLALDEGAVLAPVDDYAVTKAAGDLALGALRREGLRCVRLRPFNHTGPGQSEAFAIPAFAAQIARIEAGLAEPVLRVGNLDAERDFLDVRDVAVAYALVVETADSLDPALILNVASGMPQRMSAVLAELLAMSRCPIRVETDPQRLRPSDLGCIIGDAGRLRALTGWAPRIAFSDTLRAVLDGFRRGLANG